MNNKIFTKLFLYFCTISAIFVSTSGFLTAKTPEGFIFQLVFLPITLFLLVSSIKSLSNKNYSLGINMSLNKAFIFAALFLVLIGVTIKSVINKQDDIPDPSPSPIIIVASPLPEEKEEPKFLIINSTSPTLLVNIRSSNSTASEIVQEASHGDKYEYINFENSWYEVNLGNGSTGWVSSTYVTLEEIKQE